MANINIYIYLIYDLCVNNCMYSKTKTHNNAYAVGPIILFCKTRSYFPYCEYFIQQTDMKIKQFIHRDMGKLIVLSEIMSFKKLDFAHFV